MTNFKKIMSLALASTMLLTALAGCTPKKDDPSGSSSSQTSSGSAHNGPKVLQLYLSNPTTLDPQIWSWGTHIDRMGVFEGLTKLDKNFKPIPGNAEKWEKSEDSKVWTFHLKKDLKWSDGTPLTAKDYEFSMKRVIDPAALAGKSSSFVTGVPILNAKECRLGTAKVDDIGVKALDDHTLQITLSEPRTDLDVSTAESWALPVPKHIVDAKGADWALIGNIVSNGPYVATAWQENAKLTLEPNKNYYSKANFDKIEVLNGTQNQLLAYQAGDINIANLSNADMDVVLKDPKLKEQLHIFDSGVDYFMGLLKSSNDILQRNPKVRKAIALSIDKELLSRDIMKNTTNPESGLIPSLYAPWAKEVSLKFNVAEAKKLMAEAGFPDGKGFPEMTILIAGAPTARELAIADMITKGTGIKTKIVNEEWAIFSKDLRKVYTDGTIGYYINGWGSSIPSASGYFANDQFNITENNFTAAQMKAYAAIDERTDIDAAKKNALKKEFLANNTTETTKKYQELVKAASLETDPTKQDNLYKEAAKIREEDASFINICTTSGVKLIKPEIKGYIGNPLLLGSPPLYFNDLYID